MRNITHIVIHCTATPQTATVASIQRHWRDVLKWRSPGYHIIITPDGRLHRLAEDAAVTNGVAGHNSASLHVSYIGGVNSNNRPQDNRTQPQRRALRTVVEYWQRLYPSAQVLGHRDFPRVAKACPSFDVRSEFKPIIL